MDFKMNLSDELRSTLLESAAWDRVGLRPVEVEESEGTMLEESAEEAQVDEDFEEFSLEDIHALLSMLPEDQLLEHIDSVMSVVEAVTEVLEEEAEDYEDEE
ncbi:MAG TPA: hypothetical protein EYN67_14110 [Flavobacteriales bacterium]|nr:hypothetical protein [Flavobacteriales bacterium]